MEWQKKAQAVAQSAADLAKSDAPAWEALRQQFSAFFMQLHVEKTVPEIILSNSAQALQADFYALAQEDFTLTLELLAFDFGLESLKKAFPAECEAIAKARKERKERENEEKALAFLSANLKKYHNVYKALA